MHASLSRRTYTCGCLRSVIGNQFERTRPADTPPPCPLRPAGLAGPRAGGSARPRLRRSAPRRRQGSRRCRRPCARGFAKCPRTDQGSSTKGKATGVRCPAGCQTAMATSKPLTMGRCRSSYGAKAHRLAICSPGKHFAQRPARRVRWERRWLVQRLVAHPTGQNTTLRAGRFTRRPGPACSALDSWAQHVLLPRKLFRRALDGVRRLWIRLPDLRATSHRCSC